MSGHLPRFPMLAATSLLSLLILGGAASAQVQFEDMTAQTNLMYQGESYGASWGDKNGDGWPDLFVNHHRARPSLHINLANGSFEDRWHEVDIWRTLPKADQHGAAWSDFDNDGDQDLVVSVGAIDKTQFLVNDGQILSDKMVEYGLSGYAWGGRLPLWADFTHDGHLDWVMAMHGGASGAGRTQFFIQQPGLLPASPLVRSNASVGHQCTNNQYVQMADLTGDGALEIVCAGMDVFPNKVYDMTTLPFTDKTSILPPTSLASDSVVADFNGDLQTDLLVIRGVQRPSGALISGAGSQRIEANIITDNSREKAFSFVTDGDLSFQITWNARNPFDVHIGATGYALGAQPGGGPIVSQLSPTDPANAGIQPHDPAVDKGIYIGFEPLTKTWSVQVSPGGRWNYVYVDINSTAPITDSKVTGRQPGDLPVAPVLYVNQDGTFRDGAAAAGLGTPILCVSGAAGDFDNDGDVDLFLVCRDAVANIADRYYDNLGNGTFQLVQNTGAEGPTGLGVGLGEGVVVADYNVDGFLDLFVTNGLAIVPDVETSTGGADYMFRNQGNGNHWIEFDLVGTTTNRDAVGAIVYATTSSKTQMREQNGGYHRWAQNHQRIHFGLAASTTVDIEVRWPSPSVRVDTYTGLAADRLYRLTEGGGVEEVNLPQTVPPSTVPTSCAAPILDPNIDEGIFLWQDCPTENWHLRTFGSSRINNYQGSVLSTQALGGVVGFSIETTDVLDYTSDPRKVSYALNVGVTAQDGLDFIPAATAMTCLTLDAPSGVPVYVGYDRTPVYPPFDPRTLGPCTLISVADVTVAEDTPSGAATLTVNLSKASESYVSVDVATADGTATAPSDYTALPLTTVTFAPGETTQTLQVPISNDPDREISEFFTLNLTNPADALVADTSARVTITDDEGSPCGAPTYNAATEPGIFMWKDCTTGVWQTRVSGGGTTARTYRGRVLTDGNFLGVTRFSIEANDVLDSTTDPTRIAYQLVVSGTGQDGMGFSFPTAATACFIVDAPASTPVYIGPSKMPVATPFNLDTLGNCDSLLPPTISVAAVTVAENDPTGVAAFMLTLSPASTATVGVDVATADGTATAPSDYGTLALSNVTFAPGETSKIVNVPLVDDALAEGSETFNLVLSSPTNGVLGNLVATATIVDNETSPCGQPTYDQTTERGVFLWKDCSNGRWRGRMTGGGATATYQGTMIADQNLVSPAGVSIEPDDVLNFTADPKRVSFLLKMAPTGLDGFDFTLPAAADACFTVDAPAGVPIYVGALRTTVASPVSLATLGACSTIP
ncbi:Calx-beta domain-containing protein [uncultured Lamprocystis sp.]|uniref:Calx-beta domain-containing protein n=2 Tax=uncultured Lamprocystis sp. TaxID=543132 RepID=UPI0025CBB8C5|nr:Calx-beta domain-containing protein [uncultured Lamprocystis sp.]